MSAPRLLFLVLVSSLGAACVAPPSRPPEAELERLWRDHSEHLTPMTEWSLRGRLAVRTGSQGGQASLAWQRDAVRQSIRLNGPLGRGVVRVTQDASGAYLTDNDGNTFKASDATELLRRYTGWELPLANLDWWVRGLPVPDAAARREFDGEGRLSRLHQQEWDVEFGHYVQIDSARVLPDRLLLRRASSIDGPALEVRLVIDRWEALK